MTDNIDPKNWIEELRIAAGESEDHTRATSPAQTVGTLSETIEHLCQEPRQVRLEIVRDLLQQSDDIAMDILEKLAVADPDSNVRWAIAEGLAEVDHTRTVVLLESIALKDLDELVQSCAVGALGQRAMAAYRRQAGPNSATPRAIAKIRGGVRTRGASPIREKNGEALEILEALYRLRDADLPDYVKEKIDVTLRQLGE